MKSPWAARLFGMSPARASLDLAAFVDSEQARALSGVKPAHVRTIAEIFLGLCYDDLGKAPRFLQGEEVEHLLAEILPTRIAPGEPAGKHVAAVLTAFFEYLELNEVVTQAFEIRRGLSTGLEAFERALASGSHREQQVRPKTGPFVHGAAKLGRNDPCSCGSGKKFKKCHGKGT